MQRRTDTRYHGTHENSNWLSHSLLHECPLAPVGACTQTHCSSLHSLCSTRAHTQGSYIDTHPKTHCPLLVAPSPLSRTYLSCSPDDLNLYLHLCQCHFLSVLWLVSSHIVIWDFLYQNLICWFWHPLLRKKVPQRQVWAWKRTPWLPDGDLWDITAIIHTILAITMFTLPVLLHPTHLRSSANVLFFPCKVWYLKLTLQLQSHKAVTSQGFQAVRSLEHWNAGSTSSVSKEYRPKDPHRWAEHLSFGPNQRCESHDDTHWHICGHNSRNG